MVKIKPATPIAEFVDAVEKAARNGTKAHLPPSIARAVIADPAWLGYLASRRTELMAVWEEQRLPQPAQPVMPAIRHVSPEALSPQLAEALERAEAKALQETLDRAPRRRRR